MLGILLLGLVGCKQPLPEPPKVDVCVVLTNFDAHCVPYGDHEGEEYRLDSKEFIGGFWISPKHLSDIELYIKDLESLNR
jgi:hypothetical protein